MHRFTTEKCPPPQRPKDHRPLNLRALLESTGTPFAVAAYGPRAVIFLQGNACEGVIQIEKGCVRLSVTARGGKEAICGLLGTGAFLGEEVLGGHAVRRQTATAITATEVLVVPKGQMIRLLRSHPAIADRLIAHIVARHTHLEADVADQILKSSEQRLARTLLVLAGCDERGPCRCVLPEVSQEIIAEMVGTTRSRVNLFMGKFKKLGFIEEDGGVIEVKSSLLHLVHDGHRGVPRGISSGPSQAFRVEERYWPLAG
jgi:CRP-like cAMP-binding protein